MRAGTDIKHGDTVEIRPSLSVGPPRVSNPLVITADDDGSGRATLTVPFDMRIRTVRAYTNDPAGLRVCRIGMKSAGSYGTDLWSPYDESSSILPPLEQIVESADFPCAWTGRTFRAGQKLDIETTVLEGGANYTIELTFFVDRAC